VRDFDEGNVHARFDVALKKFRNGLASAENICFGGTVVNHPDDGPVVDKKRIGTSL
jgi:hypothetical protein